VLRLARGGASPAQAGVVRLDVAAPDGTPRPRYGGTLALRGPATWALPLAANDPAGTWQVTATDILSGASERILVPVGE